MKQIDKKFTVLVADDSPDDQYIFQVAINEVAPNAEIIFVYNGSQLVDYFTGDNAEKNSRFKLPDVILADLNMPFFSGFEALNKIRINNCIVVPVYIFSGLVTPVEKDHAPLFGVNGIFRKPSSISELKKILLQVFETL